MKKLFDRVKFVIASGALGFDGKGWWWEKILIWLGLIKPEIFDLVITKTLTLHPYDGNLKLWKPWECFALIPGGAVNKVGLTNPGIYWWLAEVVPKIDLKKINLAISIYGTKDEMLDMVKTLKYYDVQIKAIEINFSCPNKGYPMEDTKTVIDIVKSIKKISHYPIIVKVSVSQNYLAIAKELTGIAEAISFNSVPWEKIFSSKSPLWRLQKRLGVETGGGGVSGKSAQIFNWTAAEALAKQNYLPVIFPDIMEDKNIDQVISRGALGISFGIVCTLKPLWPTSFVKKFRLKK